ncbi:BTB/POZ domain protein [Ostertagia ostertagi]
MEYVTVTYSEVEVFQGTRTNANRNVLAAYSNYFKAMFTNDMIESRSREVKIVDIEASTLEALVDFCYTGKITINDENVFSILSAAGLLQLGDVQVRLLTPGRLHLIGISAVLYHCKPKSENT